jgi:hypothetical protein
MSSKSSKHSKQSRGQSQESAAAHGTMADVRSTLREAGRSAGDRAMRRVVIGLGLLLLAALLAMIFVPH